jgi:hypothetical protein
LNLKSKAERRESVRSSLSATPLEAGAVDSVETWHREDAVEQFYSTLITGYEKALSRGVKPNIALGAIVSWAAVETSRIAPPEEKSSVDGFNNALNK